MMKQGWLKQGERGTITGLVMMGWLARLAGRRLTRLLLYPICAYYLLFMPAARSASRLYLVRVLGRAPGWIDSFRHFFFFASTILDRLYFLTGDMRYFDINKYGLDKLRDVLDRHGACIFLGAHMGSFELLRVGGARNWNMTINVMMYEENAKKMQAAFSRAGTGVTLKVLPVGGIDTPLRAKQCVEKGESIAILADRAVDDGRMIETRFLGSRVSFPAGPFLLAAALGIPVVLSLGLHTGTNRYEEHFEIFSEAVKLGRASREQTLKELVDRYSERLQYYAERYRYNWFNFYDFWV